MRQRGLAYVPTERTVYADVHRLSWSNREWHIRAGWLDADSDDGLPSELHLAFSLDCIDDLISDHRHPDYDPSHPAALEVNILMYWDPDDQRQPLPGRGSDPAPLFRREPLPDDPSRTAANAEPASSRVPANRVNVDDWLTKDVPTSEQREQRDDHNHNDSDDDDDDDNDTEDRHTRKRRKPAAPARLVAVECC